jgi:aryl-alcohol dehydrogenase-like predicted oxidoreductase
LQYRSFSDGTSLSVLGIGCSRVGSLNNPTDVGEIRRTLAAAADNGINVFDTADIYGQGDSERELGKLMARHRNIFVVTKAGYTHDYSAALIRLVKPLLRPIIQRRGHSAIVSVVRGMRGAQDFGLVRLRRCVENSLSRMKTDRLPGFLLHDPPVAVLVDPAVAASLEDLEREGKVGAYGASVQTLEEVEAALGIAGLSMLQVPADVLESMDGSRLSEHLRERGIAVFVRQILQRQGSGCPPSVDVALRAAMSRGVVTSAILGISRRKHLAKALEAIG